ncbi:MAG: hypothetical protein M3O36_20770, partial [Myxococcota bacterium]|nr:hypothetical protein [Myxococcota bacterium]
MAKSIGRVVFALVGAFFGTCIVGLAEARAAASATGSTGPELAAIALAEVGVLAPLALAIGMVVAAAGLFLEPSSSVSLRERLARLRGQPADVRARAAAVTLLGCGVATAWLIATAQGAGVALERGAPMATGAALALNSLAWLVGLLLAAAALVPRVVEVLSKVGIHTERVNRVASDVVVMGAFGVALGGMVVVAGIFGGDTGGQGAGPLAIFGVLRRPELDLRPVFESLAVAACSAFALAVGKSPRPAATVVSLAAIGLP